MKKLLCLCLAALMLLSLAACGEKNSVENFTESDGSIYVGSDIGRAKLEASPNPLVPATVYGSIAYDERMLYGRFALENKEEAISEFAANAIYKDLEYSETYGIKTAEENLTTQKLSTFPVEINMGAGCSNYAKKLRGEEEWAELRLLNESGNERVVLCTYTVSGNTVRFIPLDAYQEEHDENYKTTKILYTVGQDGLEYTFEVQGTSLILTQGDKSVTLKSWYFSGNTSSGIDMGGYLAESSPAFDNIDHFSISKTSALNSVYITDKEDNLYAHSLANACVRLNENGQISFYWESEDEEGNVTEHLKHFIYFPGGGYNSVLTDGKTVYYYSETSLTRGTLSLGQGMSREDWDKLNAMSESEINKVVEKKADLLEDLAKAYEEAGLNVRINSITGEIALDATVLFGVDESDISDAGKSFLQQFTQVYTSVVYSDTYAGFVSKVLVEGHTDTSGSYEHNKTLSQARAESVKAYCTSAECGIDAAYADSFVQSLEAVGYSFDQPVYDSEGNVDMEASRRVSFRFVISLSKSE